MIGSISPLKFYFFYRNNGFTYQWTIKSYAKLGHANINYLELHLSQMDTDRL